MQVTVTNRGPEPATIHVLPHVWARNTWSWRPGSDKPHLAAHTATDGSVTVTHPRLPDHAASNFGGAPELLFCENETNPRRAVRHERGAGLFQGWDQRLRRQWSTAAR